MITRRDQAVLAALVLVLGALAIAIAQPAPPVEAVPPSPTPAPLVVVPTYREGVVGRPSSITPLTARNRAERTLVGLLFSGLTRIGPDGTPEPDLATSWEAAEDGKVWTFYLRDDSIWHDGTPVTAADVVYTVNALRDPDAPGPAAASWAGVTVTAVDERTVRFTLATPLAAFPEAASQPLLPAHLLADVPLAELATDQFNAHPIGTGPYALDRLEPDAAYLEAVALRVAAPGATGEPRPTDSLATPAPGDVPDSAIPYLPRIEVRFFDDAAALSSAFRDGEVHVASGLAATEAASLAADVADARVVRYPSTTLSVALLDQRPAHAELRDARVRRALLGAIDRDGLISGPLAGGGLRADVPYPPTAPFYDPDVATRVPFDAEAAATLLTEAGWKKGEAGWIAPAKTEQYRLELLSPSSTTNPTVRALAAEVAAAWVGFGIAVDVVELSPSDLATRLEEGNFAATIVDIRLGPELDLYPLLASSQTRTGRANVIRYQDPALDGLLAQARATLPTTARRDAVSRLIARLAADVPVLPLAWRDDPIVVQELTGVLPRLIVDQGDRFRDVVTWRLASDG